MVIKTYMYVCVFYIFVLIVCMKGIINMFTARIMRLSEEKYCHEEPLRSPLVNCFKCDHFRRNKGRQFYV